MAERVHSHNSPPKNEASSQFSGRSSGESLRKLAPSPGTYVIHVPKDQIYRVPQPENARRFQYLSRQKPRLSRCRLCCCLSLAGILILALSSGIAATVLYLVFSPEPLQYSVEGVSIKGFNLTTPSPFSPEFNASVSGRNPNGKIGIYYEKGGSVDVYSNGVKLWDGPSPEFYQPPRNEAEFKTASQGPRIQLNSATWKAMVRQQKKKTVPFKLKITAPVKIRFGSVMTWTMTVKVDCDLTVDKLTVKSKVLSTKCTHEIDLWGQIIL